MACVPLTEAEKAALRIRIRKLEDQYDAIMSGTAVKRFVDQNGEQVEYTTANAAYLLRYINELKAQLDCNFARAYKSRPFGFIFPRQ